MVRRDKAQQGLRQVNQGIFSSWDCAEHWRRIKSTMSKFQRVPNQRP